MSQLTLRMLHLMHLMHQRGQVPDAAAPAAPLLHAAAVRLVALLNAWNDAVAADLFADNVAFDEPLPRLAAGAARLREVHGPLLLDGVSPERATRGIIGVHGATSGVALRIEMQLSPEASARVQWYEVSAAT